MGIGFLRVFRQQVDAIKEANPTAKVIPSAKAIAEEVMKQYQAKLVQWNGKGMIREIWKHHANHVDMVMSAGLAYAVDKKGGRVIYCPVCKDCGDLRARSNNMKEGRRL